MNNDNRSWIEMYESNRSIKHIIGNTKISFHSIFHTIDIW